MSTTYQSQGPADFWEAERVHHWICERVAVVQQFSGVHEMNREFVSAGHTQKPNRVYEMEGEPCNQENARQNGQGLRQSVFLFHSPLMLASSSVLSDFDPHGAVRDDYSGHDETYP